MLAEKRTMEKGKLITWIAAMCVTVTYISDVQAGNWQEFRVYATSDDQQAPDIYGNVIVWEQFVDEDFNMRGFCFDMADKVSVRCF